MTEILEALQDEFREWVDEQRLLANVSSFDRGPRFAGDESQHQFGFAVDFQGDLLGLSTIADNAKRMGYVVVWEVDHLHVQRFRAGFLARCGLFGTA